MSWKNRSNETTVSLDTFMYNGLRDALKLPKPVVDSKAPATEFVSDNTYVISKFTTRENKSKEEEDKTPAETDLIMINSTDEAAKLPIGDKRKDLRIIFSLKRNVPICVSYMKAPIVTVDGTLVDQNGIIAIKSDDGKIQPIKDEYNHIYKIPVPVASTAATSASVTSTASASAMSSSTSSVSSTSISSETTLDLTDTQATFNIEGPIIRISKYEGEVLFTGHRGDARFSRFGNSDSFLEIYKSLGGPNIEDLFDPTKKFSAYTCIFLACDPVLMMASKIEPGNGRLYYLGPMRNFRKKSETNMSHLLPWTGDEEDVAWSITSSPFWKKTQAEETEAKTKGTAQTLIMYMPNFDKKTPPIPPASSESEETPQIVYPYRKMDLDMINYSLKYGAHGSIENIDDRLKKLNKRLWPGEAVVVSYKLPDGRREYIKLRSPAYEWRTLMGGSESNRIFRGFQLLKYVQPRTGKSRTVDDAEMNKIVLPVAVLTDEEMKREMEIEREIETRRDAENKLKKEIERETDSKRKMEMERKMELDAEARRKLEIKRILPEVNWSVNAKKWMASYMDRDYQDALLRNIVMAYSFAVPLHYRSLAIGIYNNIIDARDRVSKFLYLKRTEIAEAKDVWENFHKLAWGRAKNIIEVATREALKNTQGYGQNMVNQSIKTNIRNLIFKEHGDSLYRLNISIASYISQLNEQRSATPVTPITPLTPLSPMVQSQSSSIASIPAFGSV